MAFKLKDLDNSQAPLLDHLIELRNRLVRAGLGEPINTPSWPHGQLVQGTGP